MSDADVPSAPEPRAFRSEADARFYLAAIVQSSDDAIIAKDLNGVIQAANPAAERLFGYSADELVGKSIRMLIPEERQSEEDDILARIRRRERVDHFETVRVRKDRTLVDISISVSPVLDPEGRIIGVSKIARDITAQKRAAAELAAQQEWFRVTLGSIGDAVIACDPDGRVTYLNGAAARLTGWSPEDALGRPLVEVFHIVNEQTRQPVENPADLVMRSGHVVGLANHTMLIGRDGTETPIADSAAPICDRDGQLLGVVLVFRDVAEQRRVEEAIAEQREWLATTLDSIGDAVIATDTHGRVVFMNRMAERLTGAQAEDSRGRAYHQIFRILDEETGRVVDNPIRRVLAEGAGGVRGAHSMLLALDGSRRPVEETGAPIHNRAGAVIGVVLVFRDVTDQRRIDTERQATQAERERLLEAERAARGEAERASRVKDEFVAMVSHELRTPLNAILGWTEILMQGRADADLVERGLDVIARNTRIQAQLVADLLDVSRIAAGKLRLEIGTVDLRPIIEAAIETVQAEAARKRIEIRSSIPADRTRLTGDPARLQQIVWNLLSNAVKFTPEGGRVDVGLVRSDGAAHLTVRDTGVGIQPEYLPHIFDRFHQADRSITRRFGGLGLGLAIVKHLVELHGGDVRAESVGEGRGSTFTLTLPLESAPAVTSSAAEPAAPRTLGHVSLDGLHVLVVEDEPDTREFLQHLLEHHGAAVTSAGSADEALARFGAIEPAVIISDIGLPELDGYEMLREMQRVRQNAPMPPAIALTAYARPEDRARALAAGFQRHLAKPIEPADLLNAVCDVVS
jgi:PAS domain S-box-containing protein